MFELIMIGVLGVSILLLGGGLAKLQNRVDRLEFEQGTREGWVEKFNEHIEDTLKKVDDLKKKNVGVA